VIKVKAHPERREGEWSKEDKGIFMADQAAGEILGNMATVSAKAVIREVARSGKVMICGEDGEPFVGNLRLRCSREKLRKYWKKRDWYREESGRRGIWEGTRIDMSHKMMGKGGSLEDRSAVQRIAGGKRWCMSRANGTICQACENGPRSEAHVLRSCGELMMKDARKRWMDKVSKSIMKVRDRDLRGAIEEVWTRMKYGKGGEMAMVGNFQPRWVDTIFKGMMELKDGEQRTVMRILKLIGGGARDLIRLYYSTRQKGTCGREMRQTNIKGFYGKRRGIDMPPGEVTRGERKKTKEKVTKGTISKVEYRLFVLDSIMYW